MHLAHGQAAFLRLGEICGGPFKFSDLGWWRARRFLSWLGWRYLWSDPDVAFCTRVRAAGAEAVERVYNKRQMFKFDINGLDGFGGGQFVHGRDGQNRFAVVKRFHGESFFTLLVGLDHRAQIGHAVGRAQEDHPA